MAENFRKHYFGVAIGGGFAVFAIAALIGAIRTQEPAKFVGLAGTVIGALGGTMLGWYLSRKATVEDREETQKKEADQEDRRYSDLLMLFLDEFVYNFGQCTVYYDYYVRSVVKGEGVTTTYATLYEPTDATMLAEFISLCENSDLHEYVFNIKAMFTQVLTNLPKKVESYAKGKVCGTLSERLENVRKSKDDDLGMIEKSIDEKKSEADANLELALDYLRCIHGFIKDGIVDKKVTEGLEALMKEAGNRAKRNEGTQSMWSRLKILEKRFAKYNNRLDSIIEIEQTRDKGKISLSEAQMDKHVDTYNEAQS